MAGARAAVRGRGSCNGRNRLSCWKNLTARRRHPCKRRWQVSSVSSARVPVEECAVCRRIRPGLRWRFNMIILLSKAYTVVLGTTMSSRMAFSLGSIKGAGRWGRKGRGDRWRVRPSGWQARALRRGRLDQQRACAHQLSTSKELIDQIWGTVGQGKRTSAHRTGLPKGGEASGSTRWETCGKGQVLNWHVVGVRCGCREEGRVRKPERVPVSAGSRYRYRLKG
jgi:hypothetical protein